MGPCDLVRLKQERFKTAVEQELADASQLGCEAGPEWMLDPTINVLHPYSSLVMNTSALQSPTQFPRLDLWRDVIPRQMQPDTQLILLTRLPSLPEQACRPWRFTKRWSWALCLLERLLVVAQVELLSESAGGETEVNRFTSSSQASYWIGKARPWSWNVRK